jgi:molybdate transport system regulatory protein
MVQGLRLRIRIASDRGTLLGPGKAELLSRIAVTGSIAAAARDAGMSYTRAWTLVEAMNKDFRRPLVAAARGGRGVGGAALTEEGARVLALYTALSSLAADAAEDDLKALRRLLRPEAYRQT